MPRPDRLDLAGVPMHVVQRGNNRSACFFGALDRRFYLKCLAKAAQRRGCAVHAYALMSNHVHLLVTPSEMGAVSAMMQDVGRQYVRVINKVQGRTGTLWEGRFKSNLVDGETYFMTCHRYIELNPVRAGIVDHPLDFPWSSHGHYAARRRDPLITEHEIFLRLGSTPEQRQSAFLSLFDDPVSERELRFLRTAVNRGWALGSAQFLDQMEATAGRAVRPTRRGRRRKQIDMETEVSQLQADMLL